MYGQVAGTAGGFWFRYLNVSPYLLAAHARDRVHGPITVFWRGRTDIPTLRRFFLDTAPTVVGRTNPSVRAWVMTTEGPQQRDPSTLPPYLEGGDQLVRFECPTTSDQREPSLDYPFIAWARFDEQTPAETESIGVYFERTLLDYQKRPKLINDLAVLVHNTADHHAPVNSLIEGLRHLESDLQERARLPP
jgi:hypothetical protein